MISLLLGAALASDADGLDAYLAQRLDIVERPVSTVYARAYDGSGTFWFVEQGGMLIDGERFAELTGDTATHEALHRRTRRARTGGLLAVVGGVALGAASWIGPVVIDPATEGLSPLSVAGIGGGAVAAAVGTWSLGKSVASRHPSSVYTRDEAQQRARDHNETLRDDLLGDE